MRLGGTDMRICLVLILLLAIFHVTMAEYLVVNPDFYQLDAYTWESDAFRNMQLGEWVISQDNLDYDMLTTWMVEEEYNLSGFTDEGHRADGDAYSYGNKRLLSGKSIEYQKLKHAYEMIFSDLQYFPIPLSTDPETPEITYENGWMDTRTYGGERGHEGCDLMGNQKERGHYPVVSISDGVVEQVGWLEQGGWRIGIRTPSGLYLYYAHLYNYSRSWQVGDVVKAGDLLGFMGDSGYGVTEGTVGNFDVHLHLGCYLKTDHYEELSINPYWILRYLEKNRLKYHY